MSDSQGVQYGSRSYWFATVALAVGSFMIFSNVYVTQPLLPMLAADFEITPLEASLSMTVVTLMLGISLPIYGALSDVLGRRGLMLGSMAGVLLVSLLLSQVDSFSELLWLRALQGLCLGGLPAIAIAYMGDEFSHRALVSAVGVYIAGNTLGGLGGRLIGGFTGEWLGWSPVFLVMTLVCFICLSVSAYLLPASQRFEAQSLRPKRMLADLTGHLRNPVLLMAYLIGGLNFFIFINQFSFIVFVLAEAPYSLSPKWLGMLFLTYLAGTLGSSVSGSLVARFGQMPVMALGIVCLMVGTLVTLSDELNIILCGFLINAFGFFVSHSCASGWVSQNAKVARASASSLYLVFYYVGASTGGFYLHLFWEWRAWQGIVIGSLMVLAVTLTL
ncbi:MAG: MFS transporter, partial [Pontibacterium sp.]